MHYQGIIEKKSKIRQGNNYLWRVESCSLLLPCTMAGVGELIAMAVVKELAKKLEAPLLKKMSLQWDFKDDLEYTEATLSMLQAVLRDAQNRSAKEMAVCLWLKSLKAVAYDLEDFFSCFAPDVPRKISRLSMMFLAHKMKKLREKLDKIALLRSKFQFKEETSSHQLDEIRKRQTFSEVDDKRIRGRAKEKETIMRMLLDMHLEEDISFIPIVGLGGLGKTTLAQLVYNDERVKENFDLRAWVYVSLEFDLKRIGEAITSQIKQERCDFNDLQSVRNSLGIILNEKRCLIILDDLWSEDVDKLNDLKLMLKGGRKGSKIIITTRSQNVAKHIGGGCFHRLELLTEDDCWYLVKERVFGNGEVNSTLEEIKGEVAKKCNGVPLAANSLGSILLFLGGLDAWSFIRNSDVWEFNENDGYPTESKIMESLMLSYYHMPAPLKLCFAYCAIFPKGFEIDKNQLIRQWIALGFIQSTKEDSILQIIAEEYVNNLLWMSFLQYSPLEDKNKRVLCMHDLVHDLARSVARDEVHIVDARNETSTALSKYSRYILMINFTDSSAISKIVPKRARSLHFKDCGLLKVPNKVLSNSKYLRVLNLSGCCNEKLPLSIIELKHLSYLDVSNLPIIAFTIPSGSVNRIQYLNLHGCSNLELLPESISSLTSLQHLDLSNCTNLQGLPESIGNLVKLQFLDLSSNHELRKLPLSTFRLKELVHLNLSDCYNLEIFSDYVGNLKRVQFLDLSWCLGLQRLTESIIKLIRLKHLDISNCRHIKLLPELLGNLSELENLNLSGCSEIETLPESITNLSNMLSLRLCDCRGLQTLPKLFGDLCKLELLDLSNCSGLHILPESLGNLVNLEQLNLSSCYKLEELPKSFGNLHKLRYLNLSSCYGLRMLPESFNNLENLVNLDLSYCCSLSELPKMVISNSKLQNLELLGCTSLKQPTTGIEKIVNTNMSGVVQRLPQLFECKEIGEGSDCGSSSIVLLGNLNKTQGKLQITHLEKVTRPGDSEKAKLCEKERLRSLALQWSTYPTRATDSTLMDENILETLKPHQNLERLTINGYSGNKFPSWAMELTSSLPNLVQIQLCNLAKCEQLPSFEKLPNLEVLEIENLPNIKKVDKDVSVGKHSFRKLQGLVLRNMPNLMEWRTTLSSKYDGHMFPKLQKFEVNKCPNLQFEPFLPDSANCVIIDSSKLLGSPNSKVSSRPRISGLYIENCDSYLDWSMLSYLVNLEYLEINKCDKLMTLPEGIRSLKSLKYLHVSSCKNLVRLPEWLERPSTLRRLWIRKCDHLSDVTRIKKEDNNQTAKTSEGIWKRTQSKIYEFPPETTQYSSWELAYNERTFKKSNEDDGSDLASGLAI
ncbi:Disease resistance protein RGA2 [Rhynchospora pubera]|uniref:Disease resistance protein RGA2 n=1 Tax=Rhynchospora pubera TaxID=906938 RepID=A0AAV8EWD3_9POAL|nr:Disease resistance protein RGA2 [Rhynchospora pubera]